MSEQSRKRIVTRRRALAGLGAGGMVLAQYATPSLAQEDPDRSVPTSVMHFTTVNRLKAHPVFKVGAVVATAGFYSPGDGGAALYRIERPADGSQPNDADLIALQNGIVARLLESEAVNYRMFGAVGDGESDDGVQIKLAHQYANEHQIPVVNLSGEFWIVQTNSIPITTNVHWGKTIFHIDEKHNDKRNSRFVVSNDQPTRTLELDEDTKTALLEKLKPGVQIIPELAPYAGHLITVSDVNDRIGIRAGRYSKRGWAREELFYVEEEGRIIGDIAWEFNDFTTVTATPCNDNYLVIEGGGFHFSGDTPDGSPGYHQLGISVQRSRTIIRQQWMGLERGNRDNSLEPRSGLYVLSGVYDVTLENIRAMPWEKNRRDKAQAVQHGTYGIGGARMLHCTFRNLTAEAGWVAWGVFGTNLNKNFRVENCRLNRIDVHFHCWNLYISNSTIGFKGITVTGGGDLVIENTTRHGNQFVHFRPDYGAKWDGHIRLHNCTLKPSSSSTASVLSFRPSNFDYQYPIGFARSVNIENLTIDYGGAPDSKSACWLMSVVPYSKTDTTRLFFPQRLEFRNISVDGRDAGVRLIQIPDPCHYDLRNDGDYDGDQLQPNCTLICDNVQLEALTPRSPGDTQQTHLLIGGAANLDYVDAHALYPKICFIDCENVNIHLGNCFASVFFERCTINTVTAPNLRGELSFNNCRLQPKVQQAPAEFYSVTSSLGTRFTNCTLHAPIVDGQAHPEMIDRIGFLTINGAVQHYHLNTALGNNVVQYLQQSGVEISPDFRAKLQCHYPT